MFDKDGDIIWVISGNKELLNSEFWKYEKRQELAKRYDLYLSNNSKIKAYKRNYDEIVPHIYLIKLKQADKANNLRKELLKTNWNWTSLFSYLYTFYKSHKNILKNAESIYKYHITLLYIQVWHLRTLRTFHKKL